MSCPKCREGWICECHPEKAWPHPVAEGSCPGPGMPCDEPGCPDSMSPRPALPGTNPVR